MFSGRKLLIATRHDKQSVIAPLFERELGFECLVLPDLNTDSLGTFSGEVERIDDPVTTARNKCRLGMLLAECDAAIASEGSFGPHPSIPFVPVDEELLLFVDRRFGLEIHVSEMSPETNFNGSDIYVKDELVKFAKHALFPSHGLIIRGGQHDFRDMKKGITDWDTLLGEFERMREQYGKAYVETDMRAIYNPTRMAVIERTAEKLVKKIKTRCPSCETPGFGIQDRRAGLVCELCRRPTRGTLSYTYACQRCGYEKEELYPDGKQAEDPMYCDFCNP